MKMLVHLALVVTAACSDGQATSQPASADRLQASATTAPPKVALKGRVTDAADILAPSQEASLSNRLEQFERTTGHQMVVVTVPTLGGQDVAAFTKELGNASGIGRAEQDDGVILLVAPNERKARIAVGIGLETTLPDALCQQIMDEQMIPYFRKGDLAGGIDAGVDTLIRRLS